MTRRTVNNITKKDKNSMSDEIKQHDVQQGRTMAWHHKTHVKPDLSLENCWLNPATEGAWEYLPKRIEIDGKKTPLAVLGVSDNAMIADDETGEESPLLIGLPYQVKTFRPILNGEMINRLQKAIEGQGLTLESCGSIMNRGRTFFSFGLADAKFQAAGRPFEAFLNIGNGNDKSSPLWVNTSNICTVCNNTFTANLGEAGRIMSVKKTQFSEFKLAGIGPAIKAMLSGQKEFAQALGKLSQIECDEKTALEFFAGFISTGVETGLSTRAENTIARLVQLFKNGAGNDGNDMSDVFQAATDFFTHEAASGAGDSGANWKNYVSSEFGAGKTAKQEVWQALNDAKTRKGFVTLGKRALALTAKLAREENAAK